MLRRTARHREADVLIGVQGSRLVLVIGRADPLDETGASSSHPSFTEIARALEPGFGDGHLVLGHEVPSLVDASKSAKAALAGFAVARAWRNAPRPVLADDLLPERALAGDPVARSTLVNRIYKPLKAHSTELLTTLRYRLKRVTDVIGWDATGAREALILQSALVLGSIADPDGSGARRK